MAKKPKMGKPLKIGGKEAGMNKAPAGGTKMVGKGAKGKGKMGMGGKGGAC